MDKFKDIIRDVEFKKEGLGALEFKMYVTNKDFEKEDVSFRIERVSLQTYSRISEGKTGDKILKDVIKNFVALPVEARDIKYFEMATGALQDLSDVCKEFQETPLSFTE